MSRALHRSEVALEATAKGAIGVETQVPPNADFFRQPLAPILTALGVAILVVLAISFARTNGLIAGLWGAGGLAMAAWLRSGRGLQYDLGFGAVVAAGVFAGEILAGNPLWLSALFTLSNVLEIVLAVVLTRRMVTGLHVDSVQGLARFWTICAIAPLPAALLACVAVANVGGQDSSTPSAFGGAATPLDSP
ncbi:hypothetical protein V8F63_09105 [Brevundimonas sp. LF-1]|uniref:hypothetical protein n=1 Tax=Brevundimonas sp. LF-1 TaxID=3126100 RepID=UPI0030E335D4